MAHTLESYLVELFPEAKMQEGGLDNGKWITDHYKISFRSSFYTVKETNDTQFVMPGDWKNTINRLKIESNKILEGS